MKLIHISSSALVFCLLATVVHAFSVTNNPTTATSSRPDATSAVEEALKITASFGIDSKQAKVAWDFVEELDASDNSAATKAGLDEECDVTDIGDISPECVDYGKFLDELFVLRDLLAADASKGGSTRKMSLADVLKNIKLSAPTEGAPGEHNNSPELATALADAKKATAKYGITSPEAKLAWETYEDIASTGTSNAVGVNLMEECSIESGQDACKAMEELERVMPVLLAISMKN